MTWFRVEAWMAGRPFAVSLQAHSAEDAETVARLLWPALTRIIAIAPMPGCAGCEA